MDKSIMQYTCCKLEQGRIQAKKNCQHTPDGTNVDLFAGVHHTVVGLGKKKNSSCIDGEIDQPLVLYKEPQNCREISQQRHLYFDYSTHRDKD